MDDPVLVEAFRGDRVESRHRGAVAAYDGDGRPVFTLGDVQAPVFPRSAIKAFQALPLLESGAADCFSLTQAEIALACASHSGEPVHAETALAMLEKCGRGVEALECGVHWPSGAEAARSLAARGARPSALHNNCSGKHAGFICLSCAAGVEPSGYVKAEHFVQREVKAAIEDMTKTRLNAGAIDGCGIPTYAVPLNALAHGFARFGGGCLPPARASAAKRIREAVAAHPALVAGTGRFDSLAMEALGQRAFVKTGAEGVYCAAFPELGLGVAIKCQDGATRAAETAMAAVIARFLPLSEKERIALAPLLEPPIRNWNGETVGLIRASSALTASIH
ncbi:asparaginase [Methylocapsa sp. S129]|uniref:asparaginase n=1 Tax=Methylocapsa sp. S129 TaxID=1641869 RepID=UPI00131D23FC|nr:asparaginase [Methylocapsa sp. S129]